MSIRRAVIVTTLFLFFSSWQWNRADDPTDSEKPVKDWLSILKKGTPAERKEALRKLSGTDISPDVISEALIEATRDQDASVRKLAISELGGAYPRSWHAIVAARAALKDTDLAVRLEAAETLVRIDPDSAAEAAPVALAILQSKNREHYEEALFVLEWGKSTPKDAVPELLSLLAEKIEQEKQKGFGHSYDRVALAKTIARIDPGRHRQVVPVLIECLRDPPQSMGPYPLGVVFWHLARDGKDAVQALVEALAQPELRENAVRTLGSIGPLAKDALPALKTFLSDKGTKTRMLAAWAMLQIDPHNTPDALRCMIAALEGDDDSLRGDAAEILGELGPAARAALPALLRALTGKENAPDGVHYEYKSHAARAVGEIGAGDAETMKLLSRLAWSSDFGAWHNALVALEAMGPSGRPAIPGLGFKALFPDGNPFSEQLVAHVIANADPNLAELAMPGFLASLKEHDGVFVVGPDLMRLGRRAEKAAPLLLARYRNREYDERGFYAMVALRVLAAVAPEEAAKLVPELRANLKKPGEWNRFMAITSLGSIGSGAKDAVPDLIRALNDESTQPAAAKALGRIGPDARAAVPALLQMLRTPELERNTPLKAEERQTLVREAIASADFHDFHQMMRFLREGTPMPVDFMEDAPLIPKGWRTSVLEEGARALGRIGAEPKTAVPVLRSLLRHPRAEVRLAATAALIRIDAESAAELLPVLQDGLKSLEWPARATTVTVLKECRVVDKAVLANVQKLRADPVRYVRKETQRTLETLQTK